MRNLLIGLTAILLGSLMLAGPLNAQAAYIPYHELNEWDELPSSTEFGPLTGGFPDPDGRHLWLLGRCGANNCADSDRDAILKFDLGYNQSITTLESLSDLFNQDFKSFPDFLEICPIINIKYCIDNIFNI